MVHLHYATVSVAHYETGLVDITLTDRENQVVPDVPCMANDYDMPDAGDTVAVLLEHDRGRIDKGIVLGKFWNDTPRVSGKKVYHKDFKDGSCMTVQEQIMELEAKLKTLEMEAQKVKTQELNAQTIVAGTVLYSELVKR